MKPNNTSELLKLLALSIAVLALAMLLASCSFALRPDGSKEVILDGNQAAAMALRILAEK